MNLTTQIELLRLLVDGCKYHPAYKGNTVHVLIVQNVRLYTMPDYY